MTTPFSISTFFAFLGCCYTIYFLLAVILSKCSCKIGPSWRAVVVPYPALAVATCLYAISEVEGRGDRDRWRERCDRWGGSLTRLLSQTCISHHREQILLLTGETGGRLSSLC